MQTVSIHPTSKGWVVRAESVNEQFFFSGAAAETSALRLANGLAHASPVQIEIFLRDGALARRFLVPPAGPVGVGQPLDQSGA